MNLPRYTQDDLKKLPLRAIVALAARCARRVEPQAALPEGHPRHEACRAAVSDALRMAEDFARGAPGAGSASVLPGLEVCRNAAQGELARTEALNAVVWAAHAAAAAADAVGLQAEPAERHLFGPPTRPLAHLSGVSADLAALDAFTAAVNAAEAAGYSGDFLGRAVGDYEALLRLNLGTYPEAGQPVDPSPDGPLGPL